MHNHGRRTLLQLPLLEFDRHLTRERVVARIGQGPAVVPEHSGNEGAQTRQVHSRPAGQSIGPLDQLNSCSQSGSRNHDRFGFAESSCDLVDTKDNFVVVVTLIHKVINGAALIPGRAGLKVTVRPPQAAAGLTKKAPTRDLTASGLGSKGDQKGRRVPDRNPQRSNSPAASG
jgi:hypothetical protein